MPAYKLGQAAALLGVSVDTLRRWGDAGRVRITRSAGGHRLVEGADLAALSVSLAGERGPLTTTSESARNHFQGLVTDVLKDVVMAQVTLQAGPYRIVSLISREAVDELGLAPGMLAVASVKATNVVIEVPPAP
jgi:molybdopterin-binding protein